MTGHTITRPLTLGITALAMALAAPGLAATAELTARQSVNEIGLWAGDGTARVDFAGGHPSALGLQDPSGARVEGSDSGRSVSGFDEATFSAAWNQQQDDSFQAIGNDTVLAASGSLRVSMGSSWFNNLAGVGGAPTTQQYTASNRQSFEFIVDEDTAFSFMGQAIGGQRLQMFQWVADDWSSVPKLGPGEGLSFGSSGVPEAGRYRLRNAPNPLTRTTTAVTSNQWDDAMTLHNTIAAVPEPGTLAPMLLGLAAIGLRLRRRPMWNHPTHASDIGRRRTHPLPAVAGPAALAAA